MLEAEEVSITSECRRLGRIPAAAASSEIKAAPVSTKHSAAWPALLDVVASWVPDELLGAGESRTYRYRLITFDERLDSEILSPEDRAQSLAQVTRTRIGWDALPGQFNPPPRTHRRVVVDFNGGPLQFLPPPAMVSAEAQVSSGEISNLSVQVLPDGGRRATFTLVAEEDRGADMRVYLRLENQAISETWSYLWEPPSAP